MEILYVDGSIAVCVKPVGLDSESEVPAALAEQLGGSFYLVHRLDKNVGGCMVYARTKQAAASVMVYARTSRAAAELSRAIAEGTMVKEYVAMVHGAVPEEGNWEDLLWKDPRANKVFVVKRERKGVKKARLEFKRLKDGPDSLVRIRLHTGRSHQIRVQFASRGFPLVGDHKYGARDPLSAPMLFSCCLTFPHGGKIRSFSKLPDWA